MATNKVHFKNNTVYHQDLPTFHPSLGMPDRVYFHIFSFLKLIFRIYDMPSWVVNKTSDSHFKRKYVHYLAMSKEFFLQGFYIFVA